MSTRKNIKEKAAPPRPPMMPASLSEKLFLSIHMWAESVSAGTNRLSAFTVDVRSFFQAILGIGNRMAQSFEKMASQGEMHVEMSRAMLSVAERVDHRQAISGRVADAAISRLSAVPTELFRSKPINCDKCLQRAHEGVSCRFTRKVRAAL